MIWKKKTLKRKENPSPRGFERWVDSDDSAAASTLTCCWEADPYRPSPALPQGKLQIAGCLLSFCRCFFCVFLCCHFSGRKQGRKCFLSIPAQTAHFYSRAACLLARQRPLTHVHLLLVIRSTVSL